MNANWIKSCALLAGLILVSLTAQAAPTVALTAPEAGQVFIFPADVPLAADAEDNDGTITKVDFYRGNTLIGTATSAPYTATWNDAPIGNYNNIAARATDDRGTVTTSATRSISVRTAPPTVELSSPEDGQQYPVAPTVTLSVNAVAAPGASIKSVDYFRGTVRIATVTSAPYTYTWNDVGSGTHVMTARVIDDKNGTATSAARTISVKFNEPPTVALTAPEAGQVFIFPADVPLAADAEDNDGTITKVDFYRGNTLIGTATSAPYTATWNDAPIGNYNNIAARATDDRGTVTTSATRSISVRTAPPTVELSSPEDGQQYVATATVALSVNATAAIGANIKSVDYFRGTVRIATVTSAPYTYTWNDVGSGTHVMTARVIDDKNGTATSAARTITVKANEPPAVTLTAPETGQSFAAPANITISAGATDSDGAIARVDFYQGATLIGTTTNTPYALSWNNVPIGTYSLTAKVTDDKGGATTSAAHTIIVKANKAPAVALTAPEAEKNFAAPANITISAEATDSDGAIARVDFYQGATLIGTTTSTPYALSWNNVPIGAYSLTAKATDDKGATTTSAARGITVSTNQPPTINLIAPADKQGYYGAPACITLMADATDSDGTITRVDFYQGTTLIGTATSAPYAVTWNDVAIGAYSLTAKATDDKGASTTSAARTVKVESSAAREIYYIHPDHLNTPRLITNKQNQVVWRHSPLNEPFGAGTPEEDPDSTGNRFEFNLRFPGQYYDQETQTHYNYHRDYHPQTGRYLQSDPIGLGGGVNTYSYVGNNPLNFTDPEGLTAGAAALSGFGFGASSGAGAGVAGAGVAAIGAAAVAGAAGYGVGTLIYPYVEPYVSRFVDWCTKNDTNDCDKEHKVCHLLCVDKCIGRGFGSDAPACYRRCIRTCLSPKCRDNF